jgi:uncharacterized protein YcbX
MAWVSTLLTERYIAFDAPGMPRLALPIEGWTRATHARVPVKIWSDDTLGIYQGDIAKEWFTEYLSQFRPGEYYVVRMANEGHRRSPSGSLVGYADAYPFLVISTGSLEDLNRRIEERQRGAHEKLTPLGWDRFRPVVVIDGPPYVEDMFETLRFESGLVLEGDTLCTRCVVTTTNQATLERGKEPLRTLATYRRRAGSGKVVFGRNFSHAGPGVIRVGDTIQGEE